MVEDERYGPDILTQVSAMTSALQSVALGLLDDHLARCVRALAQEVSAVPGASDVQASRDDGSLRVTSDAPVGFDQIEAAVDEAGYTVRPAECMA